MGYTYSRWDGRQSLGVLDAETLIEELADDLIVDGDVDRALQRLATEGMHVDDRMHLPGLEHLLELARRRHQEMLDHYRPDSVIDEIDRQLRDIVGAERNALEADGCQVSRQVDTSAPAMLKSAPAKSLLDQLPSDAVDAMGVLQHHEFIDAEARAGFESLRADLRQHLLERHFTSAPGMFSPDSGAESELAQFVAELNAVLSRRESGSDTEFQAFVQNFGRHFPGVRSTDDLARQLEGHQTVADSYRSTLSSMVRDRLEAMVLTALDDPDLFEGLSTLHSTVGAGRCREARPIPFNGENDLTLKAALGVTRAVHDLEQLEQELGRVRDTGDLTSLDVETTHRTLGADAAAAIEAMRGLTGTLEAAGYVRRKGPQTELSARGVRKIGEKALQDIFRRPGAGGLGEHPIPGTGVRGELSDVSAPPQFGDPFTLDLNRTLMNAVVRRGPGTPIALTVSDFEVFRPERVTRSATVLMIDTSRSMPLRGCFVAARKVALALTALIEARFPRDFLSILAFSEYARVVPPERLHHLAFGEQIHGTNMQQGFMVARRLLGRFHEGTKQIILITDGEPTAHLENGALRFAYPPTRATFEATLREVKRCTREGIVINTFMLARSQHLTDFIMQVTRINHGRAFFTTPGCLGEFVLREYVSNKGRHPLSMT